MKKSVIFFLSLLIATSIFAQKKTPQVKLNTSMGEIVIELYPNKAPKTVANFLMYVNSKFYNKTIFHRVIKDFCVQGGGYSQDFKEKEGKKTIANEANNGLKNEKYSIAMARSEDPHSAVNQFFINARNNTQLNFQNNTVAGFGYCVFGKVISGLEIVDQIEKVATGQKNGMGDVPVKNVILISAEVVK